MYFDACLRLRITFPKLFEDFDSLFLDPLFKDIKEGNLMQGKPNLIQISYSKDLKNSESDMLISSSKM